jgi:hypothetical protein
VAEALENSIGNSTNNISASVMYVVFESGSDLVRHSAIV